MHDGIAAHALDKVVGVPVQRLLAVAADAQPVRDVPGQADAELALVALVAEGDGDRGDRHAGGADFAQAAELDQVGVQPPARDLRQAVDHVVKNLAGRVEDLVLGVLVDDRHQGIGVDLEALAAGGGDLLPEVLEIDVVGRFVLEGAERGLVVDEAEHLEEHVPLPNLELGKQGVLEGLEQLRPLDRRPPQEAEVRAGLAELGVHGLLRERPASGAPDCEVGRLVEAALDALGQVLVELEDLLDVRCAGVVQGYQHWHAAGQAAHVVAGDAADPLVNVDHDLALELDDVGLGQEDRGRQVVPERLESQPLLHELVADGDDQEVRDVGPRGLEGGVNDRQRTAHAVQQPLGEADLVLVVRNVPVRAHAFRGHGLFAEDQELPLAVRVGHPGPVVGLDGAVLVGVEPLELLQLGRADEDILLAGQQVAADDRNRGLVQEDGRAACAQGGVAREGHDGALGLEGVESNRKGEVVELAVVLEAAQHDDVFGLPGPHGDQGIHEVKHDAPLRRVGRDVRRVQAGDPRAGVRERNNGDAVLGRDALGEAKVGRFEVHEDHLGRPVGIAHDRRRVRGRHLDEHPHGVDQLGVQVEGQGAVEAVVEEPLARRGLEAVAQLVALDLEGLLDAEAAVGGLVDVLALVDEHDHVGAGTLAPHAVVLDDGGEVLLDGAAHVLRRGQAASYERAQEGAVVAQADELGGKVLPLLERRELEEVLVDVALDVVGLDEGADLVVEGAERVLHVGVAGGVVAEKHVREQAVAEERHIGQGNHLGGLAQLALPDEVQHRTLVRVGELAGLGVQEVGDALVDDPVHDGLLEVPAVAVAGGVV
ncbi:hypothetical protein DFJ74DRAFT_648413 [Hyaloraphidium curvatum]|nr:hypothetical protein DFJ74DRAFT_648413 [Hyaloraphidium curvatum]